MLKLRYVVLAAILAGCWTSAHPSDPTRWHAGPAAALLPDGEWVEAALDVDLDSPAQQANEARVMHDPAAVHQNGGCSVPALDVAFAAYGSGEFAFAARGAIRRAAMLDCLAASFAGNAQRRLVDGRELLITTKGKETLEWLVTGGKRGLVLGASPAVMARAIAPALRPASADPKLAPLIARARAGGQLWAAALLPRDLAMTGDVLGMLGVQLSGRVVSVIASVHVTRPYRLDIEVELEHTHDAGALAAGLLARRAQARALVGPGLRPILDAIAVRVDGVRVVLTGTPPQVDWMRALQDTLALIAQLRGASGS